MEKKTIAVLMFVLFTNIILGQTNEIKKLFEPNETDSLYILAIKKYTEELVTYSKGSTHPEDIDKTVHIRYQNYLSKIPDSINGFNVIKIGLANQNKYFRKNRNRIRLVEISPLTIKDGIFMITLIPYSARLKGKKMNLLYSHWNATYFKYENDKLIFLKYDTGGI